jgi:hypothetical protein
MHATRLSSLSFLQQTLNKKVLSVEVLLKPEAGAWPLDSECCVHTNTPVLLVLNMIFKPSL